MQQHLMHIQPTMAAYYPTSVTTDHIQQYLDENKSLILKIVESQNSGKMSECAENQARLQRNLMYLAAIADSQQPQPPTMLSQYPPSGMSQPGASHYMQSTTQQMNPHQPLTAATVRSSPSMLYGAQTYPSLQHHQQAMHGGHLGVSLASSGGLMLHGEPHVGTSMGLGVQGFPDFIRGGNNCNNDDGGTRGFGFGGSKLDMGSGEGRADAGETLYLKSANEGH